MDLKDGRLNLALASQPRYSLAFLVSPQACLYVLSACTAKLGFESSVSFHPPRRSQQTRILKNFVVSRFSFGIVVLFLVYLPLGFAR